MMSQRVDYESRDAHGRKVVVGDLVLVISQPWPNQFYGVVDAILETGLMWVKTGANRWDLEPFEVSLVRHTKPLEEGE